MSYGTGSIQPQWDLARTTADAALAIRGLVGACSMDDVQYQAVLAFETLGAGLLVHPSRIGEIVDALGGRKSERIARLRLSVGLKGEGLSKELRTSSGCISAFALTIACKTCFDDTAMANLLYELMTSVGVYKQYPVSEYQLAQLLKASTPYGAHLVPDEQFTRLSEEVFSRLDYSQQVPGLLSELQPKATADILHRVFRALKDTEIVLITLEGSHGGIWLANVLLWLDPERTEVRLGKECIVGQKHARVIITFTADHEDNWMFREWKDQRDLPTLINTTSNSHLLNRPHDLFPQRSARMVLSSAYSLLEADEEVAGQLAGALVAVAVERGMVELNKRTRPIAVSEHVKLVSICDLGFLTNYRRAVNRFGWNVSGEFETALAYITDSLCSYLDRYSQPGIEESTSISQDHLQNITYALAKMEASLQDTGGELCFPSCNIEASNVVEVAINIAAEALSSCLYQESPEAPLPRYMRGYHFQRTMLNASMIWGLVFGGAIHDSAMVSFSELRRRTSASLLSRPEVCPTAEDQELITTNNGCVVFLRPLKDPTLSVRDCAALCACPGAIWAESSRTTYNTVLQAPAEDLLALRKPFSDVDPLRVFKKDKFQGLEPRQDPFHYEVRHHAAVSGQNLQIMTYLHSDSPEAATVGLDWFQSICSILSAREVQDGGASMSALAEKHIAEDFQRRHLFDGLSWIAPGNRPSSDNYDGYITMTDGDDTLRFFVAGHLREYHLLLRKGMPLISCIKEAEERKKTLQREVLKSKIDASRGNPIFKWVIIA